MGNIHEISRPAGPRPAGLSNGLSGASFGGVPKSPAPAQTEPINPRPLDPPYPGMSQGGFMNSPYYQLYKRPWAVQRATSAPGQAEAGKRKKRMKMSESLVDFILERKKKRTEGGDSQWPGEKKYSGPFQKELPPPAATPAPKNGDAPPPGGDWVGKPAKDVAKEYSDMLPPEVKKWGVRPRYPENPPNPPPRAKGGGPTGPTRGNWRESTLIDAVLILQEMQGGNLFEKAKKKLAEGFGFSKETTKSERGIGQTTPLVQSYEGSKKKRAEGGMGTQSGGSYRPSSGKDYPSGPASSLGGNLNKILGGGKAPGPSSTDKDIGGDAGGAAGAAAGGAAGASGGGEAGTAAAASSAAAGAAGGGKEGLSSPVSSSLSPQITGGPGNPPPSQPSSTKTEGGKGGKKKK